MKKIFRLEDLDCANCAAKMERAIAKIDGVHFASVNFMSGRLTVDAEDDKFDAVMREAVKQCKRIEPDCRIIL